MHKSRLEAFSDGVIAIIITIMVLELKVPHGDQFQDLVKLIPIFLSYVLSFIYVAIYWNNHHHLFQIVKQVNGRILWANMHLLFWLSMIPFVTAWSGESHFSEAPVALYGVVLFMAAVAYYILSLALLSGHGPDSDLAKAIGSDFKGKASLALYAIAIPLAFWNSFASFGIFVLVAAIWFIPDRRIEKAIH
jgi:uncharacterized membrane protein